MFTLYHFANASSGAANIVLAWTGLSKDTKRIRPGTTNAGLADNLKDINPAGAVPALVVDENDKQTIITQNIAVLNYIAKKANRMDLIGGDDLLKQAEVLKWSSFFTSDIHTSFWVIFFTFRYTTSQDETIKGMTVEAGRKLILKKFLILEKHMAAHGGKYVIGNEKTLPDAQAYIHLRWFRAFFKDNLDGYPTLMAYATRMDDDEGVKDAMVYEDASKWALN